jgi:AcrR family transcriptional regulator
LVHREQGSPSPGLRVDARRNQQRILRAAARLLAIDPGTSIQLIADEAQVARPTVYRRYPTKEALVDAILSDAMDQFDATLAQVATHSSTAAEAVEQLIRSLARIGSDYPILFTAPSAHPSSGDEGNAARQGMAALVARVDDQIARGHRDHTIRTDIAPPVLRHALFGALAMTLQLRQQEPMAATLTPEEVGDQVASLLMNGLRPHREAQRSGDAEG